MKNLLYLLFLLSVFSACTEDINFDLKDESNNRLVVDGSITTEAKAHQVKLSRTTEYYYNKKAPTVSGATVVISSGNDIFPLSEKESGVYETASNVAGQIGKTYTLDIVVDGQKYQAKSKINRVATIDSITYQYQESNGRGGGPGSGGGMRGKPVYKLFFFGLEPVSAVDSLHDYYKWEYYIDGKLESDTLREQTFVDDNEVDGNYIHDWDVYTIDASKIVKNESVITLKMYSIPKEYFEFYLSTMLETSWKGGIFDGPPANVPSNISNGALGIFYAASVTEKTKLVKKK